MTLALKVMKNAHTHKSDRSMHMVSFNAKIPAGSYPSLQEQLSVLTERFDTSPSRNYITLTIIKPNSVTKC